MGKPGLLGVASIAVLLSAGALGEAKFDRQICNAEVDIFARRSCLIEVDGYSRKICDLFGRGKQYSFCLMDLEKYQNADPCRQDMACHWRENLYKQHVVPYVQFLAKMGQRYRNNNVDFVDNLSSGAVSDNAVAQPLHWERPGSGGVVFKIPGSKRYFVAREGKGVYSYHGVCGPSGRNCR